MLATRLARAFAQIPVELSKQGRYAFTLYRAAELTESLDAVKENMVFINQLYAESPDFQIIISNPSLKKQQVQLILSELFTQAEFAPVTKNLIRVLLENGRLRHLKEVADKYLSYYKLRDRRESVKVVSAVKLSDAEEKQVEASMAEFSSDAKYDLTFEVDPTILGGLQLYFPTAFMDLSLKSRLDKIKEEVSVLTP